GFGDCFLLSFRYAEEERHVLVDFGSTGLPHGTPKDQLKRIAADVKERTKGKLHAVVATHRHKDHISGFATSKKGDAPGDIIRSLRPDVVIQPWTEDPDAKKDAKKATKAVQTGPAREHLDGLADMHMVARAATEAARRLRASAPRDLVAELAFIG